MRINRYRRYVISFALIYLGVFLLLLGRVLFISDSSTMLLSEFGSASIIGGIVWIIFEYYFARIEGLLSEQKIFKSRGIRELRVITPKEIEEIINVISTSSSLSIQLDYGNINHGILELLNNIKNLPAKQNVRLLLAGTSSVNLNDALSYADASFEQKMFIDLVQKISLREPEKKTTTIIDVRQTTSSITNTAIVSDHLLLLLMSFAPQSGDLFWFTVDTYSQLAEQYRKQFAEYWENAIEVKG